MQHFSTLLFHDKPKIFRFLKSQMYRLVTFSRYPLTAKISALLLAEEGFVYIGDGIKDNVQCVFCGMFNENWTVHADVQNTHAATSPHCPMVSGRECENIPWTITAYPNPWSRIGYGNDLLCSQDQKDILTDGLSVQPCLSITQSETRSVNSLGHSADALRTTHTFNNSVHETILTSDSASSSRTPGSTVSWANSSSTVDSGPVSATAVVAHSTDAVSSGGGLQTTAAITQNRNNGSGETAIFTNVNISNELDTQITSNNRSVQAAHESSGGYNAQRPDNNSNSINGSAPNNNSNSINGSASNNNSNSINGSAPNNNSNSMNGSAPNNNSNSINGSAPNNNSNSINGSAPNNNSNSINGLAPNNNSNSFNGSERNNNSNQSVRPAPSNSSSSAAPSNSSSGAALFTSSSGAAPFNSSSGAASFNGSSGAAPFNSSSSAAPSSGSSGAAPTYFDLGIVTERPKRIEYSLKQKRLDTFSSWPRDHHLTPNDLSNAGFYYAGYGDCSRCFFCGGGLRNWEDEDDVWVEHARWFPKCAFMRQKVGQRFIDVVQDLTKEFEQITLRMVMDKLPTLNFQNMQESTLKNDPAVQAVLELGYRETEVLEITALLKEQSILLSADVILERLTGEINSTKHSMTNELQQPDNAVQKDLERISQLKQSNNELRQRIVCKICLDQEVAVAFLPCGHLVSCTECSVAMRDCPLCRTNVKGIVRAFLN